MLTHKSDSGHPRKPQNLRGRFTLHLLLYFRRIFKVKVILLHFIEYLRLTNKFAEFIPYVFQLLAALLESNASASLPESYQTLIAPILMPNMWETKGNVPALVRLLSAIIPRGAEYIASNNQIEPILGIFQKLVSSKANEGYGFDLLETVVASFPPYVVSSPQSIKWILIPSQHHS